MSQLGKLPHYLLRVVKGNFKGQMAGAEFVTSSQCTKGALEKKKKKKRFSDIFLTEKKNFILESVTAH